MTPRVIADSVIMDVGWYFLVATCRDFLWSWIHTISGQDTVNRSKSSMRYTYRIWLRWTIDCVLTTDGAEAAPEDINIYCGWPNLCVGSKNKHSIFVWNPQLNKLQSLFDLQRLPITIDGCRECHRNCAPALVRRLVGNKNKIAK